MGIARRNKSFEVEQARRDSKLAGLSRLDASGIGLGYETTPRAPTIPGGGGNGVTFPLNPDVNVLGNITGTVDIDQSATNAHYYTGTLTGNVTFTFSNPPVTDKEMSFTIDMTQDGTGGRTVEWPAEVRVNPTVGSAANARTVVFCWTVDGGINYDVVIVTGGSVTAGANKALSNLSTVAINTTLVSDTDNTDDLGTSGVEWKDLFIDGTAHIDTVDVDELLQITDTTTDPVANGDFRRNVNDVKVFSGGAVRNLTDISSGGGANQQLSNLSGTVAVNLNLLPNQGTGGSLGSGVATEEWFNLYVQKLRFPVKSTLASSSNVIQTVNNAGNDDMVFNVLSASADRFLWTMNGVNQLVLTATELVCSGVNIDLENNNITDANQIQITGTSGDIVFGLLSGASNVFDVQNPNTSGNIRLICDDSAGNAKTVMTIDATTSSSSNTITFEKDGSNFAVLDEIGALSFASAVGEPSIIGNGDGISIQTSASSEILMIDGSTIFRTTTSDTGTYDIKIIQDNDTPADDRALGNIDFVAENSSSVDSIYGRITATSKDVTASTEDGLLELGVASAGTLVAGISIEGGTSSLVKLGFYATTPVTQPSHIVDADGTLADITTKFNQLLADLAGQGLQASS